jgi:hypothetical protein
MNEFRPLEKIDALPDDQRRQLADWLLTKTLDKAGELLKQEFNVEIPRSTLNRFKQRCAVTAYLDTSPDSARARAEIINAAASGKPNFCQATVDLLEKEAFELAHDTGDEAAIRTLKILCGLINAHKMPPSANAWPLSRNAKPKSVKTNSPSNPPRKLKNNRHPRIKNREPPPPPPTAPHSNYGLLKKSQKISPPSKPPSRQTHFFANSQ